MAFIKRVFLFGLMNLLVIVTLTIVMGIASAFLGISLHPGTLTGLLLFALLWGMGGAFISLGMSRLMARWMMGVKIIDPQTTDRDLRDLVNRVHNLARQSGINKMPQVGIYDSPELNAFATGPTRNRSLVAVSTGLLSRMSYDEVEGVLAHEVSHINNGDMVTMTLIQGVVNALVIFFARIIAFGASGFVRDELRWIVQFVVTIVLEIALSFLGMFVVAYFSRIREYRADAGGARLAGRQRMTAALEALSRNMRINSGHEESQSVATLKIYGKGGGLMALLSTHPPLEERIKRLQKAQIV